MAAPRISRSDAKAAVTAYEKHGTQAAAARALGLSRGGLECRLRAHEDYVEQDAKAPTDAASNGELQDRIRELEAQIKSHRDNSIDDDYVKRKIIGIRDGALVTQAPRWALRPEAGKGLPGVPTLFCSDWHWGETVFRTQLNGVNEFDLKIAQRRARNLFTTATMLLQSYTVNPRYPGIVVLLGGDMLTGDIHEELQDTNGAPTMVALLDLMGVLQWGIRLMADKFGHVFLPCVTGNHGRNTRKPRAKHRNFTNFDWLLYQFLAKSFEHDDRVKFYIPDSADAAFRIYGHRYLLTHGDQFRGGDGQIGALGPITRGNKRKQTRNAAVDMGYDTMLLGHWHQWIPMLDQIVNGSLKGYDEYAYMNNFGFQLPIQGLWMTHYRWGITQTWPIYLEDRDESARNEEWVQWKTAA